MPMIPASSMVVWRSMMWMLLKKLSIEKEDSNRSVCVCGAAKIDGKEESKKEKRKKIQRQKYKNI